MYTIGSLRSDGVRVNPVQLWGLRHHLFMLRFSQEAGVLRSVVNPTAALYERPRRPLWMKILSWFG